jgi:hypothetical protein
VSALPVLTGREFDLVFKVSLIWAAILAALVLIALPWVLNWRDAARKAGLDVGDVIPIPDMTSAPDQERLP